MNFFHSKFTVVLWILFPLTLGVSQGISRERESFGKEKILKEMENGFLGAEWNDGKIIPGPLYKIRKIIFPDLPKGVVELLDFQAYQGQPASKKNINALTHQIETSMLKNGFVFYKLHIELKNLSQEMGPKIDLEFFLNPGRGYRMGEVQHEGTKLNSQILMRLAMLKKGELYNPFRLKKAWKKLSRTGYFTTVQEGNLFKDSLKLYLYPSLLLEDVKRNNIQGILGYNSDDKEEGKWFGFFDIEFYNIAGTARDFQFHFNSRDGKREISAKYDEPWIFNSPIGGGLDFRFFEEDSIFEKLEYGFRIFHEYDFHSKYVIHYLSETNTERTFFPDTLLSVSSDAIHTGLDWIFDWRESVPLTTSGFLFELGTKGIRRNESDSIRFLFQNRVQLDVWQRLFQSKWIVHVKTYNRGIYPFASTLENRGDLFYTGGSNSFRGFVEREFLTNFTFYQNYELLYQISPKNRLLVFFDPNWVNRQRKILDGKWRFGYGAGIELGRKGFVVGVNYALNPERSFGEGLLHFKLINKF